MNTQYIEYLHNKTQLELWHFCLRNNPGWHPKPITHGESWESQLSNNIEVWGSWTESSWQNKHQCKMVEVMTLWSFTVQIILSSFCDYEIHNQFLHNFLREWKKARSVILCDKLWLVFFLVTRPWILLLSNELRLHMVNNYLVTYVRN